MEQVLKDENSSIIPQVIQTPTTPPTVNLPPSSQKKKKLIIGAVIVFLLLCIIGGAIVFYKTVKIGNLVKNNPEKDTLSTQEIQNVQIKLAEKKIFSTKGRFYIEYEANLPKPSGFSLDIEQTVNFTDPKTPKSVGSFESRFFYNLDPSEIFIKGQNVTIGKTDFFKFSDFSSPALFLDYIIPSSKKDLTEARNQWIEIDELIWHRLQKNNGFWGPSLLPEEPTTTLKVIQQLFDNSSPFERYRDENVEDIETYHYLLSLNREKVENLLREVFYIENPEDFRRDEKDKNLQKIIDDFYKRAKEVKSEVWVGKSDNLVYKVNINVDISNIKSEAGTEEGNSNISRLSIELNFYRFDQPTVINPPESVKRLEELTPFKTSWGFKSATERRDTQRIDDIWEIWKSLISYREEKGVFPQLETIPAALGKLDPLPLDPGGGPCPGSYQWIPNTTSPQKILIYTCLESGKFYIFYEGGGQQLDNRPTGLNTK